MTGSLPLDEHLNDDGTLARAHLENSGEELFLVEDGRARAVPAGALVAIFARFGGELDDAVTVPVDAPTLDLGGGGASLVALRHLARFDVIARDYLVFRPGSGAPARVALAVTVAAALRHLVAAAERNTA